MGYHAARAGRRARFGQAEGAGMRAMAIGSFGPPERLRATALPRPRPGKGEVLIHVVAAGVDPIDCRIRAGRLGDALPHAFPLVPGWEAAGVVEELGEGAARFRKGERVWAYARKPVVQWGCYAEYVSVREAQVELMPVKLLFEEAAAVPGAALAARQSLADLRADQSVLILSGAGGVGHFAVQLAKLTGARVLATVGPADQSFVVGLGADVTIDPAREELAAAARHHAPHGVDLVIDTIGGAAQQRSYEALREGGRLVSLVEQPDPARAGRPDVRGQALLPEADADQLKLFAQLFDRKKLRVNVQNIFALGDAATAHRTLEQQHVRGRLVLNI
jgi:NADPH2:quinone reductase